MFCFCIVPVQALWHINAHTYAHTPTHSHTRTHTHASHEDCCESGTSPWPSSSLYEPLGSSYWEPLFNLKQIESPARHLTWIGDWTKPLKSSLVNISDCHLIVLWWLCRRAAYSLFPLIPLQWNAEVKFASGLYNVNSCLCLELMFLKTLA